MAEMMLEFSRQEVDSLGSAALLFGEMENTCGIYVLEFENGQRYVGQSVHAQTRFSQHRRRWNDIRAVSFATCSNSDLDYYERAMIKKYERDGSGLRNKALTNLPGGTDVVSTVVDGESVLLPWDRASVRRSTPAELAQNIHDDSPAHQAKLSELRKKPAYAELVSVLATIVRETIPDPVRTQQKLWTLSALPSTASLPGWHRLCTLNAGVLEVLFVGEQKSPDGEWEAESIPLLNVAETANPKQLARLFRKRGIHDFDVEYGQYGETSVVTRIALPDLSSLARVLQQPEVLDPLHELITRHLRSGSNPLRRHHNWEFAAEVFIAAEDAQ